MKKLLALIGATALVLNTGVAGVILLKNTIQEDLNKIPLEEKPPVEEIVPPEKEIDETQEIINKIIKIVSENYDSPIEIIDKILPYLNNKLLSNDGIVNILQVFVEGLKNTVPEIGDYLSYLNFGPAVTSLLTELSKDWDQQIDHGTTPLGAMRSYINSSAGNIAQAKTAGNKGQWHYVDVRAGNWNWNDFYQYIAGANMNYMIKLLSNGSYIGNLVDKHLHLGPWTWGFDKDDFLKDISSAIQKLPTTPAAWPYLVKTIVPLLKAEVLQANNPTLGFDNLTWEAANANDLSLKTLLAKVTHLLSPAGHNDLVKIFVNLLSGPFGEDIIINCGALGYYTFTEILEVVNKWPISWIVGAGLKPEVLAEGIVSELTKVTDSIGLTGILEDIFTKAEAGIKENPVVDLKDLVSDLNILYQTDNFQSGLNQLIDLINNPNSKATLKEIFALWGVQKNEENFKVDSPLFIIKKWIDDPKSILKQIINILRELDRQGQTK